MSVSSFVARPMIAGLFVYSGLDAFRNPGAKVPRAEKVAPQIVGAVGIDAETEQLVRVNGAVQVVAGLALGAGVFPRVAALALAGSLVPTTLAGHPFWEEEDDAARRQQLVQFFKNLAAFGALLMIIEHG